MVVVAKVVQADCCVAVASALSRKQIVALSVGQHALKKNCF